METETFHYISHIKNSNNTMKNQTTTNQEPIERFNCEHHQEVKAVCELVECSLSYAMNNGVFKRGITDMALWDISDDITRNAIGILESLSGDRFTNADYEIFEEIVFNKTYDYITKNGGKILVWDC